MSYGFKIMVDGDYACFTRTEMKVMMFRRRERSREC